MRADSQKKDEARVADVLRVLVGTFVLGAAAVVVIGLPLAVGGTEVSHGIPGWGLVPVLLWLAVLARFVRARLPTPGARLGDVRYDRGLLVLLVLAIVTSAGLLFDP